MLITLSDQKVKKSTSEHKYLIFFLNKLSGTDRITCIDRC